MKKKVVIFESKYGSTRCYARWLAEELSCPVFEKRNFKPKDLKAYDVIIYGGGLYAGGVSGISLLTKNWEILSEKEVILFTCGLANPDDPNNVTHIRRGLGKVLSAEIMDSVKIFHLRGGIAYSGLSFVHKAMMFMLRRMLLKKDPSELTSEDRQLLDTYGKQVDFTDRAALEPMINVVKTLE